MRSSPAATGSTVVGIDLWAFGGITRTSGAGRGPGVEFRVAAAGPLVTLAVIVAVHRSPARC